MMRYTCQACQHGEHKMCAGKCPPPPGMFGGSECDCDGNCAKRAKDKPSYKELVEEMTKFMERDRG